MEELLNVIRKFMREDEKIKKLDFKDEEKYGQAIEKQQRRMAAINGILSKTIRGYTTYLEKAVADRNWYEDACSVFDKNYDKFFETLPDIFKETQEVQNEL